MDEEKKKQIAVFRFGVIADFVTGATLWRGEKERLLKDKCARKWNIPYSNRTSIGRSTIRDWIANYQDGGNRLEALYPNDRTDKGKSRSSESFQSPGKDDNISTLTKIQINLDFYDYKFHLSCISAQVSIVLHN